MHLVASTDDLVRGPRRRRRRLPARLAPRARRHPARRASRRVPGSSSLCRRGRPSVPRDPRRRLHRGPRRRPSRSTPSSRSPSPSSSSRSRAGYRPLATGLGDRRARAAPRRLGHEPASLAPPVPRLADASTTRRSRCGSLATVHGVLAGTDRDQTVAGLALRADRRGGRRLGGACGSAGARGARRYGLGLAVCGAAARRRVVGLANVPQKASSSPGPRHREPPRDPGDRGRTSSGTIVDDGSGIVSISGTSPPRPRSGSTSSTGDEPGRRQRAPAALSPAARPAREP